MDRELLMKAALAGFALSSNGFNAEHGTGGPPDDNDIQAALEGLKGADFNEELELALRVAGLLPQAD